MTTRRILALALVAATVSAACSRDGSSDSGDPTPTSTAVGASTTATSPTTAPTDDERGASLVEGEVVTPDGRTRTYRLHVPEGAARAESLPLLVALHGGGGSAGQYEQASGFAELAATDGVLVVFPDGYGRGEVQLLRTWNAGDCCGPAVADDVDDVAFVRQLVEELAAEHPIDPRRVLVAGHSNGAAMAYRLACELSDVVVAIGVQSGPLGVEPCEPARPVSVLHVHGSDDANVPIDGGVGPEGISGVDFWPVRRGLAAIAAADGCASEPEVRTMGQDPVLTIETWDGCEGGSVVELVVVEGAGHAWMGPGGTGRRGDAVDVGYDSTAEIWGFLSPWVTP